MIKAEFSNCLKNYEQEGSQPAILWNEIEKSYSAAERKHHTITHLNSLVHELIPHKNEFTKWAPVVFAIAYHDIVYDVRKNNNEEASAEFATRQLAKISFPENLTAICNQLILATKKHEAQDRQTNLFTDADLSILGADPQTYSAYAKQIRAEYAIFPDEVYNQGRRNVLNNFLQRERIYKTKEFSVRYESQARINLQIELNSFTHEKI